MARREAGMELMDEVLGDPDLTIEERNAAMLQVGRYFGDTTRSRQLDPVTLRPVHQEPFPEEIYGSETTVEARTTDIITHDPSRGISPYSITFDSTNKAISPNTHISSFLQNPARLADIAWSGRGVRDLIGRAWQSLR